MKLKIKTKLKILIVLMIMIGTASFAHGAKKTKWQGILERNNIPQIYWQKYLPKVNRTEYKKAVKEYQGGSGGQSDESAGDSDGIKIVEGKYALPASSGKIAREQHLWLSSSQKAKSHYKMTDTPKSCQNGMAGGYGSFGALNKGDKKDEIYYVTMRWGYADWTEPESDLAEDLGKSAVSLILKSASDFPKSGIVKIGSEYMKYSSKSGNKLKGLKRGYKSSASSHGKGDSVKLVYKYKGGNWERVTRALRANSSRKKWYKGKKVLVTNNRNGKKVIAAILESGPAIWTNRVGGLSPEAFEAISARNNENCTFQYADDDTDLGPV